jgi:hypothetical protein
MRLAARIVAELYSAFEMEDVLKHVGGLPGRLIVLIL